MTHRYGQRYAYCVTFDILTWKLLASDASKYHVNFALSGAFRTPIMGMHGTDGRTDVQLGVLRNDLL